MQRSVQSFTSQSLSRTQQQKTQSGSSVICWCWYMELSPLKSYRNHLPESLQAFFCSKAVWKCWFPFPASLGIITHSSRITWSMCWLDQWPESNPTGSCKTVVQKNEKSCQIKLGFHSSWSWSPPCHGAAVNHAGGTSIKCSTCHEFSLMKSLGVFLAES